MKKAEASDVACLISAAFRSTRCNAGKSAILSVIYSADVEVAQFVVVDDLGNYMTFTKVQNLAVSSKTPDRRTTYLYMSPTAAQKGARTFTVYAVYADGSRSADSLTAALTVR